MLRNRSRLADETISSGLNLIPYYCRLETLPDNLLYKKKINFANTSGIRESGKVAVPRMPANY